jgi:hypothetical protein
MLPMCRNGSLVNLNQIVPVLQLSLTVHDMTDPHLVDPFVVWLRG